MKEKVIGILGGMGPEATVDVFVKILKNTPVDNEQDHLRIIIDNNPKVPNRTEAIISGNVSQVIKTLQETALNLERSGVDFIIMTCNTAHYFLPEIQKVVSVPIIDMIKETVRVLTEKVPYVRKAGLLATTGTIRTGIYHKVIAQAGIELLSPKGEYQEKVMTAIKLIKDNGEHEESKTLICQAARWLIDKGAEALIGGCTEIPLVLTQQEVNVPLFDATEILAKTAVRIAKGF